MMILESSVVVPSLNDGPLIKVRHMTAMVSFGPLASELGKSPGNLCPNDCNAELRPFTDCGEHY